MIRLDLKAISEKLHPLSSVYECWSNFTANERYINGGPWKLMKWNRHTATGLLGRSIKQSEPQNTLNLKSSLNNCKPVFSLLCKHDCEVGLSCRCMCSAQIDITRRCSIWACHVFILCEYPHLAKEVGRRLQIILLQVPTQSHITVRAACRLYNSGSAFQNLWRPKAHKFRDCNETALRRAHIRVF